MQIMAPITLGERLKTGLLHTATHVAIHRLVHAGFKLLTLYLCYSEVLSPDLVHSNT